MKRIKKNADKSELKLGFVVFSICLCFFNAMIMRTQEYGVMRSFAQNNEREQTNTEIKKIAITFDDGPHPKYTPILLDELKKRNVKATFFVTGQNAEAYPEIIERMQKDGHVIGNHTYHHIQLTKGNLSQFKEELQSTNQILYQITQKEIIYVRPPYGEWDKSLEKELNMIPVLWTVDPLDWCTCDTQEIIRRTLKKVKENDIILLHDSYDSSVKAALAIIDKKMSEGYSFVTIDEILFD